MGYNLLNINNVISQSMEVKLNGKGPWSILVILLTADCLMMMTAKSNAQFLLEMLIDLLATTVISIIALNVSYIRLIARRSTAQKYGQLTRKVWMVVVLNGGRIRVAFSTCHIKRIHIFWAHCVVKLLWRKRCTSVCLLFVLCIRKS